MEVISQNNKDQIQKCLTKILDSKTFGRSARLRAFLQYVVGKDLEGLSHQLKGYAIGVDVFSRKDNFDPGSDPLVRVQAGKLRKLLTLYYVSEGKSDPVEISIPVGAYVPEYRFRTDQVEPDLDVSSVGDIPSIVPAQEAATGGPRRRLVMTALITLTLINAAIFLYTVGGPSIAPNASAEAETVPTVTHTSAELPRIYVENLASDSNVAAPFADALRLGTVQVPTVELISRLEPNPENGDLAFTVTLSHATAPGSIVLSLRHNVTGQLLKSRIYTAPDLQTSNDRIFNANSFVGEAMSVSGDVYRFATLRNDASDLMKCMKATFRFKLMRSRETFVPAVQCQQALNPHEEPVHFVTELKTLIMIARRAEKISDLPET